ncbi:MAG: beta-galactosidase GalB [Ferruginibacter sp.]
MFLKQLTYTLFLLTAFSATAQNKSRERISLNSGWKFTLNDPSGTKGLSYDVRPAVTDRNDNKVADSKPTEAISTMAADTVLKKWILPAANNFIKDITKHHTRPEGNPGGDVVYVQNDFDDRKWQSIQLPHDWAINAPFYTDEKNPEVGGGMGRLPIQGIGWYRKKIDIPATDKDKHIYLDIDGAMSYSTVWLNSKLLGGWPYGYNSYRLDLTPYLNFGGTNQLAIRIDNPNYAARWYPGAGLYRNVWLTKVNPVHIAQWGTFVNTTAVSDASATIHLSVAVENNNTDSKKIMVATGIYLLDADLHRQKKIADFKPVTVTANAAATTTIRKSVLLKNPRLWGPPPAQQPSMYCAVTRIYTNGQLTDEYETRFGIRSLEFNAERGLFVNNQPVRIQGVNQHHDLGALGGAFNYRAAERQLEILKEAGCNAIRLAHNPPAPELLDLTDKMGFLVIDEIFDSWERKKTPHDFHLLFPDWYEADTRSFIRRDKNHPSVIAWSYGNEVGEQYTADTGALIAKTLYDIVKEEDSTRPATASMNYAKPNMPFPAVMDIISLNYQGEGIRDAPAYAHLKGIRTSPLYPAFHEKFPGKFIVSSETASALSTRGSYIFPVSSGNSAPVSDSTGGDPINKQVSAYELYTAAFGSSADKVFASQDKHPFVAGEFVWSGWDYLGEPTPYYTARSSYCGFIDLAGFKKDRFYLYQSRWRPNLKMVHILPHWNWPGRTGMVTPVHVFTSGDEAELFLNGHSLGKKKKGPYEYRLRWDDVIYEPGTLKAVAYKNGSRWSEETVQTTGAAAAVKLTADRKIISADGSDLCFITAMLTDKNGFTVPDAKNSISFSIEGPGEIIATDNGDPACLVSFASKQRDAYYGLALVIVRSKKGQTGLVKITAASAGLQNGITQITTK